MCVSTQRELEAPKRTERAWSKSATDHCWGCGAGQISIRPVRWLYQQEEESKSLSHSTNMSNEEELRAQCSSTYRDRSSILPKSSKSVKQLKHLQVPERVSEVIMKSQQ